MSPSDIQEILEIEPFKPLRFTLSSGDQIVVGLPHRTMVSGGMLYISSDVLEPDPRLGRRAKVVSTVNVAMVERLDDPLPPTARNGKRRRR
jgi:hypothetical protein